MSDVLTLEPGGEATHGACADCGATTRSVWGFISNRNGKDPRKDLNVFIADWR